MKPAILISAMLLLAGTSAHGQCLATSVDTSVGLFFSLNSKGTDVPATVARIDGLAKDCATNPFVQKIAAMTHNVAAGTGTDQQRYDHAVASWNYVLAVRKTRGANEADILVMGPGNQPIELSVWKESWEVEKRILATLFEAEMRSGKSLPEHTPPKLGEKLRNCASDDSTDAQLASSIVQQNPKVDVKPALDMLDRLVAICSSEIAKSSLQRRIPAGRARALFRMVKENPARPDAIALLEKAEADSKAILALDPAGDSVYWSAGSDAKELAALAKKVRDDRAPTPAEEDWFKPENVESSKVVVAIAMKLDEAWAKDEPLGVAGKYVNYRKVIGDLYSRALASGNIAVVKKTVATAARGHSNGTWRRPENAKLQAPPDWLWNATFPEETSRAPGP